MWTERCASREKDERGGGQTSIRFMHTFSCGEGFIRFALIISYSVPAYSHAGYNDEV